MVTLSVFRENSIHAKDKAPYSQSKVQLEIVRGNHRDRTKRSYTHYACVLLSLWRKWSKVATRRIGFERATFHSGHFFTSSGLPADCRLPYQNSLFIAKNVGRGLPHILLWALLGN